MNIIEKKFSKELSLLNKENRAKMIDVFEEVPEYFWHIPASSTGKYHPEFSLGEGGLVRHTQAAVEIFKYIFICFDMTVEDLEKGVMALLYHDTFKSGEGEGGTYTAFDHPLIAAKHMAAHGEEEIASLISSHMGRWTTSKYSDAVLPTPDSRLAKAVHMADYISSRKWLTADIRPQDLIWKIHEYKSIEDLYDNFEAFNHE